MSDLLKKIEAEVQSLTQQERAFLADRLLSSLGHEDMLDEIELEWIAESERRYSEYQAGHRKGIPAADVFQEAGRLSK